MKVMVAIGKAICYWMCKNLPFFVLFLVFCGYSTHSLLPSHLKTVALVEITNSAPQPGLAEELNGILVKAFNTDRTLRVTSSAQANLALSVIINNYSRTAAVYDANQVISAYEITIGAQVEAFDQVRDEPFFSGIVSCRLPYNPDEKSEEEAIKLALEKLAQEIVRQVLTAW